MSFASPTAPASRRNRFPCSILATDSDKIERPKPPGSVLSWKTIPVPSVRLQRPFGGTAPVSTAGPLFDSAS